MPRRFCCNICRFLQDRYDPQAFQKGSLHIRADTEVKAFNVELRVEGTHLINYERGITFILDDLDLAFCNLG